jgi:CRISPR-associated protein Csm3
MSAHTASTELKLIGKLILEGDLHCETGLHVGAGKGSLEIGGSDNPVVKDSSGRPYVPGSSLRGRIRSLLEQATGLAVPTELVYLSKRKGQEVRIHQSDRPDDDVCILFGRSPGRMERVSGDAIEGNNASPARLAVFDAPLDPESITQQMRENLDDELTEVKSENAIDRITSQANPRTIERVPAGARFRVRFVVDVLCDEDAPLFALLVQGLRLLEDDTLGGGGSRGSGRVRFANLQLTWRGKDYYATGAAQQDLVPAGDLAALQTKVQEIGTSYLSQ